MHTYICVEREALEHMSIYICFEQEALEHMSFETFVLSMKLSNIRSLAIVSLGVSYKYILALVLSEELCNCTEFLTPYF